MTETDNGLPEPPVPVLAGHLVIYGDAIAFRADGSDTPVVRVAARMMATELAALLSPGDGGRLAPMLAGDFRAMLGGMKPMEMISAARELMNGG
jgi:hypothetical protein